MLTLLVGGLMAAPLAPLLVTKLAPDVLGAVVGGMRMRPPTLSLCPAAVC